MDSINVDEILFRASSTGKLMTDPKTIKAKEAGELSETTISYLVEKYILEQFNRYNDFSNKYTEKGLAVEQNSVTTLSRIRKKNYVTNTENKTNSFVSGTPDIVTDIITDIKSSFSVFTFFKSKKEKLNKDYYWQIQTYCALFDKPKGEIAYVLENSPYKTVEGELRKESCNHLESDTPQWIELQIIANHTYDYETFEEYYNLRGINPTDDNSKYVIAGFKEIPMAERLHTFEVERNDEDIERLYDRIKQCREYMNKNFFKN